MLRPEVLQGAGWDEQTFDEMFSSVQRVSDTLPVESATGAGTYALTMKQLSALGCPYWDANGHFFDHWQHWE